MVELLFGSETEYALAGISPDGSEIAGEELIVSLMQHARQGLVHLPDVGLSGGMFLANAGKLYIDCGTHPELATAECSDPATLVSHIEAGHRILANLTAAMESERPPGTEIVLLRNNVDLSGTHSTWGCHESYLHRRPLDGLRPYLVPHLVTRVIYTGAGGFDPYSHGLEFMLSPRAAHIRVLNTESSTTERGIWHSKTEPLCRDYQRLHVLCGESECSHTAMWLKFGVTALIVAMADAGFEPVREIQLRAPLAALRTVATDASCTARLRASDGHLLSAIAIQRIYLESVEAFLAQAGGPPWAAGVCARWRQVLDSLETDPASLRKTLDWGIKLALYQQHARGLGIQWELLPVLNRVIKQACVALRISPEGNLVRPLEQALRSDHGKGPFEPLQSMLTSSGLRWDDVWTLLRSRNEFFEIDTRFSQLGRKGIFAALDAAGALDHSAPAVVNVEQAMKYPPEGGRAAVRGQVIRALAGSGDYRCDWQRIVDMRQCRLLDLSHPFEREEVWKPISKRDARTMMFPAGFLEWDVPEPHMPEPARSFGDLERRQQALQCYMSGNYTEAETLLRECTAAGFELSSTHCHLARALIMMDREMEAREEIENARRAQTAELDYAAPRILFFDCIFAMLDGSDPAPIVAEIKCELIRTRAHMDWTIGPVLDHLRGRLGAPNYRFLQALANALSWSDGLERMNRFRQWRRAEVPASLEGQESPESVATQDLL